MLKKGKPLIEVPCPNPATKEGDLHDKIIEHCNRQFPRWKYIHSRMDKRSTIAVGAQDFTIFMPDGKILCIECKAKGGKLDDDQLIWRKEMEMLGHTVNVVWSFDEFLKLL